MLRFTSLQLLMAGTSSFMWCLLVLHCFVIVGATHSSQFACTMSYIWRVHVASLNFYHIFLACEIFLCFFHANYFLVFFKKYLKISYGYFLKFFEKSIENFNTFCVFLYFFSIFLVQK